MPALLTARVQKAAERATLTLPFTIPAKEHFSPREAAAVMGLSESFVEKLFDQSRDQGTGAQLSGHEHNAGSGARMTKRIPRAWIVAYMVRTARYDDAALADAFVACLPRLPAPTLLRIASVATRLAAEKGSRA